MPEEGEQCQQLCAAGEKNPSYPLSPFPLFVMSQEIYTNCFNTEYTKGQENWMPHSVTVYMRKKCPFPSRSPLPFFVMSQEIQPN